MQVDRAKTRMIDDVRRDLLTKRNDDKQIGRGELLVIDVKGLNDGGQEV